jgi:hypothetical protein
VSTGEGEFNDETINGRGAFLHHLQGEDVAADDGEKFGSLEFANAPFGDGFGVEGVVESLVVGIIIHINAVLGFLHLRQGIERGGDLAGDSGTHEDEVNFSEHGSEERSEVGDLDFFEKIDADGGGMVALGQPDFDKIGDDGEFKPGFARFVVREGSGEEWFAGIAVGAEVLVPDPFCHVLKRKCGESVFEFASGITHLKPSGENGIYAGPGDDTHVASFAYGTREGVVADGDAHAALDDHGRVGHFFRGYSVWAAL